MGLGDRDIYVYDQRTKDPVAKTINLPTVLSYENFTKLIIKEFNIPEHEEFVISTTSREEIEDDTSIVLLEDGDTLYILNSIEQELFSQTKQKVHFLPHYDTLVKSGMYEYYNSEGQNPLPYAFAELIDNSLTATATNTDSRNIELRFILDPKPEKCLVCVIDNGHGMSSWQLNNWAIYRLSKFIRQDKSLKKSSELNSNDAPEAAASPKKHIPRSLNSEISYFGVGGKQAIFFIGNGTRMITKRKESLDVHELCISKEQFEQKEQNKEFIYSGEIRNRKVADSSHLEDKDELLKKLIAEEEGKESFTCVVIHGISAEHLLYLKQNFHSICSHLAHIYHYYIHGPNGNDGCEKKPMPTQIKNINIEISLINTDGNGKCETKNLREVEDDMQTKYIQTSHSVFEFKAVVDGTKIVEGLLRYHPFLYDQETYPQDTGVDNSILDEDSSFSQSDLYPARGRRPIFECFWNGRLIPYTVVRDFEWCTGANKKQRSQVPPECYNRVSGVLWTNEDFQVSTNKLTFLDLENRMKDITTTFQRVINGQEKRGLIEKQFNEWISICHEKCDKQILFKGFQGHIGRPEQQKLRQFPWAVFNSIEWDGKVYSRGQYVRVLRTIPHALGTIKRFFLYGEHDEDEIYATGGDFEIQLEPVSMYGDIKCFPLSKLDRKADEGTILKALEQEEDKLPHRLIVNWPEGDQVFANEQRAAGKTIGAIKVEISNRRGELISKVPGTAKKLMVDLKLVWHSPKGDFALAHFISSHAKTWPYWFRKMENVKELGQYTLSLQAVINENETVIAGKVLPSYHLKFTIIEGAPEKFSIGNLEGPFRIGVPFEMPLVFHDKFGNSTKPIETFRPILQANGLSVDFDKVRIKGNLLVIKGVTALGHIENSSGKNFSLSVKVLGLDKETHSTKIRVLPGPPRVLLIKPDKELIEIENNNAVSFDVVAVDASGNVTSEPKFIVGCKFLLNDEKLLQSYKVDISSSGKGILTGPPLLLKSFNGNEIGVVTAKILALNRSDISIVERKIIIKPSRRAMSLRITYTGEGGKRIDIEPECEIERVAGQPLTGLEFLVYDEGGRPVKFTSNTSVKIKVNWARGVKDMILSGKLPDIMTPLSTSQNMYCQITLTDASVIDFGFTIKPIPGKEHSLKVRCESSKELPLGEELPSDILVDVLDKHSNLVSTINSRSLSNLIITGDKLDTKNLEVTLGQTSSFVISKVSFTDDKLGSKEIQFKFNDLRDSLRLEVTAGPPTKILYPLYETEEFVTVQNAEPLPHPLVVQLCDNLNNFVKISGIKVQLGMDEAICIIPIIHANKTNEDGFVNFGDLKVALKHKRILPKCPVRQCAGPCKGVYSLCAKAVYNKTSIMGPMLKIHIPCDTKTPVSLKVKRESQQTKFDIGKELPDFTVLLLSENGNAIENIKSSQLKMKISPHKLTNRVVTPSRPVTYVPSEAKENNSWFYFRKKQLPPVVGHYKIEFSYTTSNATLNSEVIDVEVVPGPPQKLVPEENPGFPAVSNTSKFASRCLVKSLKLHFEDGKNNVTGSQLNGTLHVQIMSSDKREKNIPKMVGNVTSIEVPIVSGRVSLQNVTIEENSPGVDGKEYILRCKPNLDDCDSDVAPYDVRFIFCNDSKKQAEISQLSKERDNLLSVIKTYQTLFDTSKQLLRELDEAAKNAYAEENRIKSELRQLNFNPSSLTTLEKTKQAIAKLVQTQQKAIKPPKRVFGLTPAPDEPGVLGKIGQLAYVENEDVARVLSWHMQSDMDCVITHRMEKARELHKRYGGKLQLLPLDSIFQRNLPDWSRPMIHAKIRNYNPPGNPIYVRDCLIFPKEPENCKKVFGMLLGDTILLDTLDDATRYRENIVKHMFCPTLLTRTGDRVRSNGKFGGQQNKAPPIDKMRGVVFGEPPQTQSKEVEQQIELLENLKLAIEKSAQMRDELAEQQKQENSTEIEEKAKEFATAQKKLKEVEAKLRESSSRGTKRQSNGVKLDESALNGLGGLGLTRSQMMRLKSLHGDSSESSPSSTKSSTPPLRKKRKN